MRHLLVYGLAAVGAAGMLLASAWFVRVTLPRHYGSNPGFGAYESGVAPWWAMSCVALGLSLRSVAAGLASFGLGLLVLGFVGQLLSRIFGRSGS